MATALLVGSGAVHNAWGPVCLALEDVYGKFPPPAANTLFASIVYELRWYNTLAGDDQAEQRKALLDKYNRLRARIAFRLREARQNATIYMREPFVWITRKFVTSPGPVVTTNWDLTIVDYIEANYKKPHPKPIFLHGTCEEGKPLYLPSETIEEPYRTDEEKKHFGQLHVQALQLAENCDRLVVYGLSMDPLDAELGVVLLGTLEHAGKLREVIVLDVNPVPVMERLRVLLMNLKPSPRFEARAIIPEMRSNFRIVKDRRGHRVDWVFYDDGGRPDSSLPPQINLVKNVRDLKRTLRAMAKAAGRHTLPSDKIGRNRNRRPS